MGPNLSVYAAADVLPPSMMPNNSPPIRATQVGGKRRPILCQMQLELFPYALQETEREIPVAVGKTSFGNRTQ